MIVDRQGRRFRNLRISLTAACNYACTYCVADGKRLVAAEDELSADALGRAVAYLIEAAGIERLRITGGEPLVSCSKSCTCASSTSAKALRNQSKLSSALGSGQACCTQRLLTVGSNRLG